MDAWTVENGALRAGIGLVPGRQIIMGDGYRMNVPEGSMMLSWPPTLVSVCGVESGVFAGTGALVAFRNTGAYESTLKPFSAVPGMAAPTGRAALELVGAKVIAVGVVGQRAQGEFLAVLRPGMKLMVELRGGQSQYLCVTAEGEPVMSRADGPATTVPTIPPGPAQCVGPYPGRWCPASMVAPSAGDAHEAGWTFFSRDPAHAAGAWRCPRCVSSLAQVAQLATEAAKVVAAKGGENPQPWGIRMGPPPTSSSGERPALPASALQAAEAGVLGGGPAVALRRLQVDKGDL